MKRGDLYSRAGGVRHLICTVSPGGFGGRGYGVVGTTMCGRKIDPCDSRVDDGGHVEGDPLACEYLTCKTCRAAIRVEQAQAATRSAP